MNEENLWNAFVLSGSVTDYLNYAKNKQDISDKGEKPYGSNEGKGTDSSGNKT